MSEVKKKAAGKPRHSFVVSGAVIQCSCGTMKRTLRLKKSHGVYINDGKAQMNIRDNVPNLNIMPFENCKSPTNPNDNGLGIGADVAGDLLGGPLLGSVVKSGLETGINAVSSFLGLGEACKKCLPVICLPWIHGKEDTLVEGHPALLNISTLKCIYGGTITIVDDGQKNK